MLPARHRLRTQAEFAAVLRGPGRARAGSRLLVVHANRTDSRTKCPPRVGFVVSKAVGGAVMRNRVKRRLRAASSTLLPALDVGTDLVVRAQPDSAAADFPTLEAELKMLAHKALRQIKVA